MKRTSVAHLNSASAKAIDVVGEFWNLLIIRAVFMGVTRFEGLQSDLRIARNILTDRLSTLIEADVLEKLSITKNQNALNTISLKKVKIFLR